MKKLIFLVLISLFCSSISAQKKKPTPKNNTSVVLAKAANLTAELVKDNFYLFINNQNSKDTITLKKVNPTNLPIDCKILVFTAKQTPLYLITWNEKVITKTDLKTEEVVQVYSEIFEIETKTMVVGNVQTTTHITEKVFLDKLKNASETQQRIRREGFEFTLLPDGDVTLKNKTQENKFTYSPNDKKYVDAKQATKPTAAKPAVTKKKR
jgi:hypothetical protein